MSSGNWGGSAAGGGLDFQAAVSALCMTHMACGTSLGWFELGNDIPLSVSAETGGAGDDIALVLTDGSILEVQAKRRLRKVDDLWIPLIALCQRAHEESSFYGVLAVGPASSLAIRDQLARDIIRIGQGRTDDLSPPAVNLMSKLCAGGIPLSVCGRVRIQTIHVLEQDGASAQSAIANLKHITTQPGLAWERLKAEGVRLIKLRGRLDTVSIAGIIPNLRTISSGGVGPAVVATQIIDWTLKTTEAFTIPALDATFSLDDDWIELKAKGQDKPESGLGSLEEALTNYHRGSSGLRADRDRESYDAETLGYFVRQCVIVAGPGMGKSQLLRRIARLLARKREPSLIVRLRPLAERMRSGETFIEAVMHIGLDGSSLMPQDVQLLGMQNLTLLLDGLDESGTEQDEIAKAAASLAISYPRCRIVFATRPIGYETSLLNTWRHYELVPIESSDAKKGVERLVDAIKGEKSAKIIAATTAATNHLDYKGGNTFSAKSPLLIALLASLALNEVVAEASREGLYGQLFKLIERMTAAKRQATIATPAVLNAFLQHLGWELTARPYTDAEHIMKACAQRIALELGEPLLKARSICDDALDFWEKAGIVERVRFKISEALTFVHKTFGEYAAAQYLVSRTADVRTELLTGIESTQQWNEVVVFSAAMGLGQELVELALVSALEDSSKVARLLRWTKYSNEQLKPDTAEIVLQQAWAVIAGPHSRQALSIGVDLVAALANLPGASIYSQAYRVNSQWWTALVGWVSFGRINPEMLNFVDLLAFMDFYAIEADTRSVSGGFQLFNPVRELWEVLQISAAREAVHRGIGSEEQKFINRLMESLNEHSMSFVFELKHILIKAGIDFKSPWPSDLLSTYFSPEYFEHNRKSYLALLNAVVKDSPENVEPTDTPLLHLSAFWFGTGLMGMEISAASLAASSSRENEAMQTVNLAARFCSYDYSQLITETHAKIRVLKGEEGHLRSFEGLLSVDAPIKWSGNRDSSTKFVITRALLHESKWIVSLAANLAEHLLTEIEIAELVPQVLLESKGFGTAAGAHLALHFLGKERARGLIIARLKQPLNSGSQHLFQYLAEIWTSELDEQVGEILTPALLFGPRTAIAALFLARACGESHRDELNRLLKNAYEYWIKNEEPYPTEGGIIPESPRGNILELLIEEEEISHDEMFVAAKDKRNEVSRPAIKALLTALSTSEVARNNLVQRLHTGEKLESLLTECLRAHTPFDEQDVYLLARLLESEHPETRFAATGILERQYLHPSEIRRLAKKLLHDPYQQLRDKGLERLALLEIDPSVEPESIEDS